MSYKVLIADDEPKIRKKIRGLIDWTAFGFKIVAEAEDGELALSRAKETMPDLLLVDINMPFINGLELIEKLKNFLPGAAVVIISGHDEFNFAQKAVTLRVFDYLLKPVKRARLEQVIENIKEELDAKDKQQKYLKMEKLQWEKNMTFLRQDFLISILKNEFSVSEIEEGLRFYHLDIPKNCLLLCMKKTPGISIEENKKWDSAKLDEAIEKTTFDMLGENRIHVLFRDENNNLLAVISAVALYEFLFEKIKNSLQIQLKTSIITSNATIENGAHGLSKAYQAVIKEIDEKLTFSPIVSRTLKYIEDHYSDQNLAVKDIADKLRVSTVYISRLLKNETGYTFVEHLTNTRINRSLKLLREPTMKIVDIANMVGYSTQHYFSTAFKKVMGFSPSQYKSERFLDETNYKE